MAHELLGIDNNRVKFVDSSREKQVNTAGYYVS